MGGRKEKAREIDADRGGRRGMGEGMQVEETKTFRFASLNMMRDRGSHSRTTWQTKNTSNTDRGEERRGEEETKKDDRF